MDISTKHLKAFRILAAEKNFTKAASLCHLTQPALSVLIQNLEHLVGAKLFIRNTRNVVLTPEGLLFESIADDLLQNFENAFSELKQHVSRQTGQVAVAALPSVSVGCLIPVVAKFRQQYPGISVSLFDVSADECLRLVNEKKVDFALTSVISLHPALSCETLCSDSFFLVCSKNHTLASKKKLTHKEVMKYPIIQFAKSTSIRQHLDASFYPEKLVSDMEVFNLSTVAGLVENNIGISIIPEMALFPFIKPSIQVIPLELAIPNRLISLVKVKENAQSVAVLTLIDLLKKAFTLDLDSFT